MAKEKIRMNDITLDHDIRYRGPLSYRALRIVGWVMLVFAQVATVLAFLATHWDPATHNIPSLERAHDVFVIISGLSVPLFLVANFAIILQRRDNIKQLVITHLLSALGIALLFYLVYYRYLTGVLHVFFGDEFQMFLDSIVSSLVGNRLSFNVFIDLLIYSSFHFFLTYRPKKIFVEKKLIIFRCFLAFPILWEATSIVLKGLSGSGVISSLPMWLMPLLASKPLFSFLAFISITFYTTIQRRVYLKKSGTEESYQIFKSSNYESFAFSKFVAKVFLITAAIDIVFSVLLIFVYGGSAPGGFAEGQQIAYAWGIGDSFQLLIGAPVLLLFNYRKTHSIQSKNIDTVIPLIGVVASVLVYLEGFYAYFVYL